MPAIHLDNNGYQQLFTALTDPTVDEIFVDADIYINDTGTSLSSYTPPHNRANIIIHGQNHYIGRSADGSVIEPLRAPLFGGRSLPPQPTLNLTIENLTVQVNMMLSYGSVSPFVLVGRNLHFYNVHTMGWIECSGSGGSSTIGGFVPSASSDDPAQDFTFTDCTNDCGIAITSPTNISVTSGGFIGSCAGLNTVVTMTNCTNKGSISGVGYASGFVGMNESGSLIMTDCRNEGHVVDVGTHSTSFAAGFIGDCNLRTSMKLTACVNTGDIGIITRRVRVAGGLIGTLREFDPSLVDDDALLIRDCSNFGAIAGKNIYDIGGILGVASNQKGLIERCVNYGSVTAIDIDNTSAAQYEPGAGGIVGQCGLSATPTIKQCVNYGSVTMSNTVTSPGGDIKEAYNAGGIVGVMTAIAPALDIGKRMILDSCYNFGIVQAYRCAGGIVGSAQSVTAYMIDIIGCQNMGDVVSDTTKAGGILGLMGTHVVVDNCAVSRCAAVTAVQGQTGGIVGYVDVVPSLSAAPGRNPDSGLNYLSTVRGSFSAARFVGMAGGTGGGGADAVRRIAGGYDVGSPVTLTLRGNTALYTTRLSGDNTALVGYEYDHPTAEYGGVYNDDTVPPNDPDMGADEYNGTNVRSLRGRKFFGNSNDGDRCGSTACGEALAIHGTVCGSCRSKAIQLEVGLYYSDGTRLSTAASDDSGHFTLSIPPSLLGRPGTHCLIVRKEQECIPLLDYVERFPVTLNVSIPSQRLPRICACYSTMGAPSFTIL